MSRAVIEVVISLAAPGIRLGLILPPGVDLPDPAVDLPPEISDIADNLQLHVDSNRGKFGLDLRKTTPLSTR